MRSVCTVTEPPRSAIRPASTARPSAPPDGARIHFLPPVPEDRRTWDRCPLEANLKGRREHALTKHIEQARAFTAHKPINHINGHPDLESARPARSQLEAW